MPRTKNTKGWSRPPQILCVLSDLWCASTANPTNELKVFIMPTEYPACREADSGGSNSGVEAPWIEPVSRSNQANLNEPRYTKARVASLSKKLKPEIRREVIFKRSGGTLRGQRGQRAGKVELGRLGDPCRRLRLERSERCSESISCALAVWESERPVVAKKRGNARGAKGPLQKRSGLKESGS